jgi:beta-lactamase regulating signal transducer with metallopeptidase domain
MNTLHELALSLSSPRVSAALLEAAGKSFVILAAAVPLAVFCRRSAAATRHFIWLAALACVLVLPLAAVWMPRWSRPAWAGELFGRQPVPSDVQTSGVSDQRGEAAQVASGAGAGEASAVMPPSGSPATAADRTNTTNTTNRISWRRLVLPGWAAGVVLTLLVWLERRWRLWKIERAARPVRDPEVLGLRDSVLREFRLRREVRLLETAPPVMPMTWGFWRPAALLPAGAAKWERERLRLVLRHEVAHVRRGDCLTQALAAVVCALYWFNPLAWLAAARMRVERERACDDLVVALGETRASDYAGHLLEIARQLSAAPRAALPVARRSGLEQRLRALLDNANNHGGLTRRAAVLVACALAACLVALAGWRAAAGTQGGNGQFHSKWDEAMLNADLHDVQIEAGSFRAAWDELVMKYLLRANLYMDVAAISDETLKRPFAFHKEKTTGKELFDAILTAYPAMTYTQSKETGIIWFHPKRVKYEEILSLKVRVAPGASHIPMYRDVYLPLCGLLGTNVIDEDDAIEMGLVQVDMDIDPATGKPPIPFFWLYDVDLPAGVFSAREILDYCCASNPTKAFDIQPVRGQGPLVIFPKLLIYNNPQPFARAGAIRFWELELGKPANGTPSLAEVRAALSDPDPGKRSAASLYVEASDRIGTPLNFDDLVRDADGSEQAVWTALELENALWRDALWKDNGGGFLSEMGKNIPGLQENLKKIGEPKLALIASLEMAREKADTSYLDAIVSKHKYSEEEIASIEPELYRMARQSKAVRDKLIGMKFQVAALSPEVLNGLENTNFLTLASAAAGQAVTPADSTQIITLSDGHQFRFAGASGGTNHVLPGELNPVRTAPGLFIWLEPTGSNASLPFQAEGSLAVQGVLADEKGLAGTQVLANFSSDTGTSVYNNLKGPPGFLILWFPVVPRRSQMLECRLDEFPGIGAALNIPDLRRLTNLGRLKFRNPLFGNYPQWQPETLPAVKSAGEDIKVRLNSFGKALSPARQGDPTYSFSLTFESPRSKDEKWTVAEVELTDATGNRIDQDFGNPAGPDGYGIYSALWPDEAAGRLTLTLKRTSGFLQSELVTFTNLPVLHLGNYSYAPANGTSLTNNLGGIPIVLRNTLTDAWHQRHAPWGGTYCVEVELPTHPPGVIADIVEVANEVGNVLTAPDSVGPNARTYIEFIQVDPTSRGKYLNVTAVTSSATYLNVAVAVQKTRTVEFLVKPQ